jgi:transposase-like protein
MEAWVHGVSTRKVDDLVKAMGSTSGISKSEVSRICAELDGVLSVYASPGPHRRATRHLRPPPRPQSGHQLGVPRLIVTAVPGPFHEERLGPVPKASAEMVAASIRTIFAQPDAAHVRSQLTEITEITGMLRPQFPDVAAMHADASDDILAFTHFPAAHWKKIWSTNPLERLNGAIKRRTNVVGIFPNDNSVARLITVVVESHDEWQLSGRRYLSEESMAKLHTTSQTEHTAPTEKPLAVTT